MMLAVTDEEARELDELLDAQLREMRGEIARTDDRAYRSDLRDRYDHLERLRLRLKQAATSNEVYV
ncbi:MAG: hypothetical protein JWM53_6066 [bacterium]|nr:hypothetical protein [bacterium]